jgi:membrane-associated protease RseP (regulator of RpoE activity)
VHDPAFQPAVVPARPSSRLWVHGLLFLGTLLTTTLIGIGHASGFASGFGSREPQDAGLWLSLATGLRFSVPLLSFLLAHEFGHYLAARAHGLHPSLPYFIPFPSIAGTMGAVIIFRGHFPNRRVLFDFAAAGPLAGFVVSVVILLLGLQWSEVLRVPPDMQGYNLGEPLLFQWAAALTFGGVPDGLSINLHPTAFAGWLGLFFTALNLIPVGQLDGGHVAYTVLGPRTRWLTLASFVGIGLYALVFQVFSWLFWLGLMVLLMRLFGWTHPPALDEEIRLDPVRVGLVILVLVVFIVTFIPVPLSPLG